MLNRGFFVQIRGVGDVDCDRIAIVTDEVDPPAGVFMGDLGVD